MGQFICANPQCRKHFYSKHSIAKYCSRQCANIVNKKNILGAVRPRRFSLDELLQMLVALSEQLGKTPSKRDVNKHLPITAQAYTHHFGTFRKAIIAAGLEPNRPLPPSFMERDREHVSYGLRFQILKRDGFRCQYCGGTPQEGYVLHVDHIIPRSKGGETVESNLITACFICNGGKSASL